MTMDNIESLWECMKQMYGGLWTKHHGEKDHTGIWQSLLGQFHPQQIKNAIGECVNAHPDYPPTLPQFRALCKQHRNPEAPHPLPPPKRDKQTDKDVAREWLAVLKGMLDEKSEHYRKHPMTDEERAHHWRVLGLDQEPKPGYFVPGSRGACAFPGCSGPGALAQAGADTWYCREHFRP